MVNNYMANNKTMTKEEMMNQFELAFYSKDIKNMEKYYVPSSRDNYFIDIALDEGNKDVYLPIRWLV
jgi:hypothetical protein